MNERIPTDGDKAPVAAWVVLAFSIFACVVSGLAVWLTVFK